MKHKIESYDKWLKRNNKAKLVDKSPLSQSDLPELDDARRIARVLLVIDTVHMKLKSGDNDWTIDFNDFAMCGATHLQKSKLCSLFEKNAFHFPVRDCMLYVILELSLC